jgi:hypothetical protein
MADGAKSREPWIDPDPQPGDFDAELDSAQPGWIEIHDGDPEANLTKISASGEEPADNSMPSSANC